MTESSKLAVVIAAGGTAGHVRPALAVAEALRKRGASVTFAGSPDRVESRLVPEAGFELDTFAISGLPRKPSVELVRALWRAVQAPFACRAILRRRRPDVVLGGGGYVAGPMVLAARLSRIPAALTEADAHLGPREPARRAVRVEAVPRLRDPGSRRAEGRGRRPADPDRAPRRRPRRARGRGSASLPTSPWSRSSARSPAPTTLNEMAVSAWAEDGPTVLHVSGERDYAVARRTSAPARLRPDGADGPLRRRARRGRHRRLPRRRHRLGARCRGHAVDSRPLPVRDRRPPDAERPALRARAEARSWCRTPKSTSVPALVEELLADPERLASMREAMLAMARVDAADRIAEGVIALARR